MEWIRIKEAAEKMSVVPATIHNWGKARKITLERRSGEWWVHWPSVEKAVESHPHLGQRGRPSALTLQYEAPRPARETEPLEKRIYSRIMKESGGCWVWMGTNNGRNMPYYPASRGERIKVRQWVYFRETGKTIPSLHATCGRSTCVRPEHMGIGGGVLSLQDNEDIKRRWALSLAHSITMEKLGREYGVSRQRIEQLVRGIDAVKCEHFCDGPPLNTVRSEKE